MPLEPYHSELQEIRKDLADIKALLAFLAIRKSGSSVLSDENVEWIIQDAERHKYHNVADLLRPLLKNKK